MSMDIKFEEQKVEAIRRPPFMYSKFQRSLEIPPLIRMVMKTRVVRNETQAQYVVISLIAAIFIASITIGYFALKTPDVKVMQIQSGQRIR